MECSLFQCYALNRHTEVVWVVCSSKKEAVWCAGSYLGIKDNDEVAVKAMRGALIINNNDATSASTLGDFIRARQN